MRFNTESDEYQRYLEKVNANQIPEYVGIPALTERGTTHLERGSMVVSKKENSQPDETDETDETHIDRHLLFQPSAQSPPEGRK